MSDILIKQVCIMKNINILIVSIFLLVLTAPLHAQTPLKKDVIKSAEEYFADKNYYAALKQFNDALGYDSTDVNLLFKAGESARMFNSYARAAEKYSILIDSLKDDTYPAAIFYLANMKQRLGKYDDARKYYNIYLTEYGGMDSILTARAKKEIASVEYGTKQTLAKKKNVKFEKLEGNVNTPSSEVAGNLFKDEFFYSSMNYYESTVEKGEPERQISKLLKVAKDSTIVLLPGYINERQTLVSNATFNTDGSIIYYTVCNYINGSDIRCEIYKSNVDSLGVFTNEVKLPAPINMEGSTATHPHLTKDKATGKEILFFVSDRIGGKGGLDIWYSLLDPKFGFSEPINIQEVNTPQDEITPFYHKINDFLYFSSDGMIGLGGFDIYKAPKTNDAFGLPVNAGMPLNSSYNDIYYFEKDDGTEAYMSSNREGAFFLDAYYESCCYDIYKMDIVKIDLDLNALTYDKLTGRDLKKATVILLDKETGQELGRVTNDDGIDHKFPLAEDRSYIVIAERENYYPDTIEFSTFGAEKSETIIKKMYLSTDMMLLDVFTFTKIGKLPLDSTTVTLIDITDPTKRQEIQFNPLSNDFYFMLDRGKEYKLIARKEGYTDAEEYVDTRPYDKSGLIRRDMYLDKFELPDLLPIALYFDNDLPDKTSRKTTTNTQFGTLVTEYMSRKETYKTTYAKPLPLTEQDAVKDAYESFFEGDVRGGFDKFKLFLVTLKHELEAGNKVELVFKGYASPRAENKYNLALGQRRVNSVKNEMMFYEDEGLKKYFLSGQLKITDISFGKELSPPDVPSDLKDERNSIYNMKAAKERRVEILRASRTSNNQ